MSLAQPDHPEFYARLGLAVFPCHGVTDDASCSCADLACPAIAKHPLTPRGLLDATTNENTIQRWLKRWPRANWAVATGTVSGVDVLDIDPRHGGQCAFDELVNRHGPLPPTWSALTGSGGKHFFFEHWRGMRNSTGRIGHGLDVRGDGGYAMLAGSRHVSGVGYTWIVALGDVPLAPWPAWLAALALPPITAITPPTAWIDPDGLYPVADGLRRFAEAGAPEGGRNSAAFWLSCRLVQDVGNTPQARHWLNVFAAACQPSLAPRESERIWGSATQRQPFAPRVRVRQRARFTLMVGPVRPPVGLSDATGPARPPRLGGPA